MTDRRPANILVVDDIDTNIDILVEILTPEYDVAVAMDGQTALEIVEEEPPDLILLDIMMPDMDGYEVCKRLKANKATFRIPVVFVTAMSEVADEAKGFDVGGVDYITKPISPPVVLARIKTHLALANQQRECELTVERQVGEILQSYKDSVYMLGRAGHYNDDDYGMHIWRMASFAKALARADGWPVERQQMILLAAAMHDTGKIGIPRAILKSGEKRSEEDKAIVRKHATIGYKILSVSSTPVFQLAADIALCHHERWDGNGYPRGLVGEEIPKAARIVSVVDVFDALTMRRAYKKPWSIDRAFKYMADDDGHFDPRLLNLFLGMEEEISAIMDHWNKKEKNRTV